MQDAPRLYFHLLPQTCCEGEVIALDSGQVRYLATVLRLGIGDTIHVFNEKDGEWQARLKTLHKERGTALLLRQYRAPAPQVGPVLVFAPLKRDATDLVLRMGTEMGVLRFCPVVTERTNTHRINAERLRAIAREAAEQCERLDVPHIDPLRPIAQVLDAWDRRQPLYAALERSDRMRVDVVPARHGLLIGPEGGFSDNERRLLCNHEAITPVSLGNTILRADTAAVAGLALLAFRASQTI